MRSILLCFYDTDSHHYFDRTFDLPFLQSGPAGFIRSSCDLGRRALMAQIVSATAMAQAKPTSKAGRGRDAIALLTDDHKKVK